MADDGCHDDNRRWFNCQTEKRWKNLKNTLQNFKNSAFLSDVELQTTHGSIYAHKVVLAAGSEYFRTLFGGHFKEKNQSVVDLSETFHSIGDMQDIINYLYGADIVITDDNLKLLLHASSILFIPEITAACGHYMINHLNLANCLTFWLLSEAYSLVELEKSFSKLAKIRFNDTYSIWEETLSIPVLTLERLFKCGFAEFANASDLDKFLNKYFEYNNCVAKEKEKERLSNASGLSEKMAMPQSEVQDNMCNNEALFINIDLVSPSELIYVNSCNRWFTLPHWLSKYKHIYEMCLGPNGTFVLAKPESDCSSEYVTVDVSTMKERHVELLDAPETVSELSAVHYERSFEGNYFVLNGKFYFLLESYVFQSDDDLTPLMENYIFHFDFQDFQSTYIDTLFSFEQIQPNDYECIVECRANVTYICAVKFTKSEMNLYGFFKNGSDHVVQLIGTYYHDFSPFSHVYFLLPITIDKIGFGIRNRSYCQKLCQYDATDDTWQDLEGLDDILGLSVTGDCMSGEPYDCQGLHYVGTSPNLPLFHYFVGRYEGQFFRLFYGQLGQPLKDLAPFPQHYSCMFEDLPQFTFNISPPLLDILVPVSYLGQLEKPLLEYWSKAEMKQELEKRLDLV